MAIEIQLPNPSLEALVHTWQRVADQANVPLWLPDYVAPSREGGQYQSAFRQRVHLLTSEGRPKHANMIDLADTQRYAELDAESGLRIYGIDKRDENGHVIQVREESELLDFLDYGYIVTQGEEIIRSLSDLTPTLTRVSVIGRLDADPAWVIDERRRKHAANIRGRVHRTFSVLKGGLL